MHKNISARPRSKGNTVWALIMSWLSSLLLTLLAFFLVLLTTICSPAFMKQQVARSGFSETAYTYLYDNFVSYGASSGFSADVMTSAISRDQITADMDSAVTRLYDGDTALDSRDSIQTATYDALLANLNDRGVDVTADVESAVAIVADACRLDYSNYVAIPLASQLYTIIEKFNRIVPISVAAMALVCAASIFLMLRPFSTFLLFLWELIPNSKALYTILFHVPQNYPLNHFLKHQLSPQHLLPVRLKSPHRLSYLHGSLQYLQLQSLHPAGSV